MGEDIQRKYQNELDNLKTAQKELQTALSTRQQLDGQLTENEMVKHELSLLPAEGKVFKSVGPVLIKTEVIEAKQNVSKRIDYITKEMKKVEDLIGSLEKKQDNARGALQKLQHQLQQAQVKAALHA
uniref:Probable prefoldin subunit 6 n=1 Tax=Dendroctonus ponderosae TaxID=77166 RepID=J3JTF8_DENPD|nr:unknown [Dendroctonus ponderosae]